MTRQHTDINYSDHDERVRRLGRGMLILNRAYQDLQAAGLDAWAAHTGVLISEINERRIKLSQKQKQTTLQHWGAGA